MPTYMAIFCIKHDNNDVKSHAENFQLIPTFLSIQDIQSYLNGFVQKGCSSLANAVELQLIYTNPLILHLFPKQWSPVTPPSSLLPPCKSPHVSSPRDEFPCGLHAKCRLNARLPSQ